MRKKYRLKKKLKLKNIAILFGVVAFIGINIHTNTEHILSNDEVNATDLKVEQIDKNDKNANNSNDKIISKTKKNDDEKATQNIEQKKTSFKVVIDATYGGRDGGSKGYNGILQKDVNLAIALKVKSILEKQPDVDVILTRKDDSTLSMEERVKIVNDSNADFVISIMQNTEGSGEATGVETYILPSDNEKRNTTLGYIMQKAMIMYSDTKDRGVLARNMDILVKSDIPGAVVNTGFISNKTEGLNLSSENYQLRMAEGLSQGILLYIDKHLKK